MVWGAVPVLLLVVLAASFPILPGRRAKGVSKRPDSEFAFLSHSLDVTERRLLELEKELGLIVALDEKVRVVSDLYVISKEVRDLGVGGTDWHLRQPESVRPELGRRLALIGERIDALKRQTRFEHESFEEIVGSLSERQRRLAHTPSIMPARGFITSHYGWRRHPFKRQSEFHRGLDVANLVGTPVVSTADGQVCFAGWKSGFGRFLEIDHGYGYVTRYGHLSSIMVRVGDRVFRGQTVARVGSSGAATGPHVHYEVLVNGKHTNPKSYIRYAGLF
jgi:murein DD-endopeptidase MepM/ murein hydrolase activator NlpD